MKAAPSLEAMQQDPVGYCIAPSANSFVWCVCSTLCGAVTWGCPQRPDVERILAAFDAYRSATMAPRFSIILDGRDIEAIDSDGLATLLRWLKERRAELAERIEIQFGVIAPESVLGVTLSGILPVIGETHNFRVVSDPRVAFRELWPDGDQLFAEVERGAAEARRVPDELRRLRALLRVRPVEATLTAAARSLGVAKRTLQRQLKEAGTTFRDEVRDARFVCARDLLLGGSEKVASIAHQVGLSERALTQLVREKSGQTPAELRRGHRA